MKIANPLMAGALLLALWSCDDSVSNSDVAAWPQAPDGFEWPAAEDDAIEFQTVANADADADVKKAAGTLKSRYSPEDVTFAHSDLNDDGLDEILIKTHHYGFAPSYAILSQNESGDYSDIGWISGDQIFTGKRIGKWQSIQAWSGNVQRRLYSFRDGLYQATRAELFDPATQAVTTLLPTKAEQDADGNPH